jgi:hypothetical protein
VLEMYFFQDEGYYSRFYSQCIHRRTNKEKPSYSRKKREKGHHMISAMVQKNVDQMCPKDSE